MTKLHIVKAMVFPVVMYELDQKEGWALKNSWFWIVVLEKTLEGPWNCKETKPVSPKGNQPWILIKRTDAKTEAPILWSSDVKSQLTGKDPDAGKDWGQEDKGATKDEMVRWHHQFNGHEFEQTLEIVKEREAWYAAVHGVTKNRTYDLGHTIEHRETWALSLKQEAKMPLLLGLLHLFTYLCIYLYPSLSFRKINTYSQLYKITEGNLSEKSGRKGKKEKHKEV